MRGSNLDIGGQNEVHQGWLHKGKMMGSMQSVRVHTEVGERGSKNAKSSKMSKIWLEAQKILKKGLKYAKNECKIIGG